MRGEKKYSNTQRDGKQSSKFQSKKTFLCRGTNIDGPSSQFAAEIEAKLDRE